MIQKIYFIYLIKNLFNKNDKLASLPLLVLKENVRVTDGSFFVNIFLYYGDKNKR